MGLNNREKEKKFVLVDLNYQEAISTLNEIFPTPEPFYGVSKDLFWEPKGINDIDFIRLRDHGNNHGELTVKHTDKKDISDRVEIDVPVIDLSQAQLFLEYIFGAPVVKIRKQYAIWFIGPTDTSVSVYKVYGDKRIFLEVEAPTIKTVDTLVAKIVSKGVKMTRQSKSLYNLIRRHANA